MSQKSRIAKRRDNSRAPDVMVVQRVVRQELSHYSGPLPQSGEMEQYERISPGYAKELLEMAKSAQAHEQKMDESRFELHRDFSLNHQKLFGRGQIIGGILSFSAIGSGTVFCIYGHAVAGGSMIGAVIAALGGAFAWGKWQESRTGNTSGIQDQESDHRPDRDKIEE
jgi:uncharacterized membrane protein